MTGNNGCIWTIGHGTANLSGVLSNLGQHGIVRIFDVRSAPYSSYQPAFNREVFSREARAACIEYKFMGDMLGGRPKEDNFYDEDGYVLYEALAKSNRFQEGLADLNRYTSGTCSTLFCAEEDPIRCHRHLLIGRVLVGQNINLVHIRQSGAEESWKQAEERLRQGGIMEKQIDLFATKNPSSAWKSTKPVRPPIRKIGISN